MKSAKSPAFSQVDTEVFGPTNGDRIAAPALLEVNELAAGYRGRAVLAHLHLSIKKGERVAIIGPNGCGKSTLLRALTGEIVPSAGQIRFAGKPITAMSTDSIIRSGISYLRQKRNVFPTLTVADNLDLARSAGNVNDGGERTARLLEAFPFLSKQLGARAGLLSGGERQVLALAMALARPSSLVLLDEPIAGLSQKAAGAILNALHVLQAAEGFAMVVVEHRLQQIQPWMTRVVIMVRGEIVADSRDPSILSDRARLERYYRL